MTLYYSMMWRYDIFAHTVFYMTTYLHTLKVLHADRWTLESTNCCQWFIKVWWIYRQNLVVSVINKSCLMSLDDRLNLPTLFKWSIAARDSTCLLRLNDFQLSQTQPANFLKMISCCHCFSWRLASKENTTEQNISDTGTQGSRL